MSCNQSGIALILVVSIMAVLASIAAAFSYSMIMDQRAAANYMTGVKADYVAKAGIQHAIGVLKKDGDPSNNESGDYCMYEGYDWYEDDWGYDSSLFGIDSTESLTADSCISNDANVISTNAPAAVDGADSRWINLMDSQGRLIGRYAVLVIDESGKININSAGTSYGEDGWTTREIRLDKIFTTSDAGDILDARYGNDDSPGVCEGDPTTDDDNHDSVVLNNDGIDNDGDNSTDELNEGVDDPAEFYIASPYINPTDDLRADTSYLTPAEVVSLAGIDGDEYARFDSYITTYSSDKNLTDSGLMRMNINAVSSAMELYSILRDACEYWEGPNAYTTEELAQMAVNIIDYRDRDSGSTRIDVEDKDGNIITRYGVEGIRINEVMVRPVFRKDGVAAVSEVNVGWAPSGNTWTSDDFGDSGIWSWSGIPDGTYKVNVYGSGKVDYLIYPDSGIWSDTHFNVWLSDTSTADTVVISGGGTFKINIISKKLPTESPVSWYRVDLSQSPDCEYVELVNISENDINIGGWRLEFPNGQVGTIPNVSIGAGAYAVLAIDKGDSNSDGISVENTWFGGPTGNVYQLLNLSALDDILSDTVLIDSPLRLYDGPIESTISGGIANPAGHIVDQVLWDSQIVQEYEFYSMERNDPAFMGVAGGVDVLNDSGIFDSWLIHQNASDSLSDRGSPAAVNVGNFSGGSVNVKNFPFANIGEIADVSYSKTTEWETIGNIEDRIRNIADSITVSGRRLDAEFADHTNANWGSPEKISDLSGEIERKFGKSIIGELYWFRASDSASAQEDTWTWYTTRDRFEADTYIMYVYGREGGTMRVRVGNDSALITPSSDYGAKYGQVAISDTTLSVAILADASSADSVFFDYILLTPASKTYGRININTADTPVLQGLQGVGATNAPDFLANRPFKSIGEILPSAASGGVDNIGTTNFQPISNLITTKSNVFKIICTGQSILDKNGNRIFDVDDEVLGEKKITVIYER
ncbi:general secretion pathway protein GspK [bacterium]|nr:general secretion pathway protein GspK [bacterium]